MATKKFTIPSLSEMEKSRSDEEYKVKSLFEKRKTQQPASAQKKPSVENSSGMTSRVQPALNGTNDTGKRSPRGLVDEEEHIPRKIPKMADSASSAARDSGKSDTVSGNSKAAVVIQKDPHGAGVPGKVKDLPGGVSADAPGKKDATTPPRPSGSSATGTAAGGTGVTTVAISPNRPARSTTSSLIVSTRQRGNPLLKHVRNVVWEFSDIVADYEMGATTCALFLSLRYHALNPNYIHERLKLLGHSYDLRVLLVQVDTKDPHHALMELSKICILADCTLICAWSPEEAARYIETYKMFEKKPPDLIMEKQEEDFVSRAQDVLTSGRKINRTDAVTVLSRFGSVAQVVGATEEELEFCPGLGANKAARLHTLLHTPFVKEGRGKKLPQGKKAAE